MWHHHEHDEHDHDDAIEIKLLKEILETSQRSNLLLGRIVKLLEPPPVTSFTISQTQTGDPAMALLPLAPGNSPVFTATPQPSGATLPVGVVPTWTSSDTTNAPLTVDATGLIATVAIASTAPVGGSVTLTVTATLADGTTPTGTFTFTIVSGTVTTPVTSFTIAQTT